MPHYCDTSGLDRFCENDGQHQLLAAIRESATNREAAERLGTTERNVQYKLSRIRARAAKAGFAPDHDMTKTVPDGYSVKGISTLYDGDGLVKAQWVKSQAENNTVTALQEAREALFEKLPRERAVQARKAQANDLLNLYVVTDYHVGMYAWGEETGADWDAKIAEDLLVAWFAHAIKMAPASAVAVLGQLGDFLHWDGIEAVTPASRHLLDADTRFQKLVRIAIRVIRRIVRILLQKHNHVHLIMAEGNHDTASSMWLREMLDVMYEDEPRVSVDLSPDPYYCYEHGQTSLFFHHGHKRPPKNIDHIFTAKFREVFGRTKFSYGHMGHLHHDKVLETNLMHIEQHQTLAAPDAYASRGGWMSGRSAKVITYSKEYGEVGRMTLTPDMVQAA